ncbi:hypothetical protein [Pedobacter hartonius]|uniref:Uncharacterized protein n=1 Tax=Pedobacter hartonius TaxID=425514 RepID=A0A1H3ZRU8_9SPHI|nr:hypothetical protein [Pedobacter hartonius]SEA26121.1 hypothetical protein SAMN05443550_102460 [Pedobacter hartonius]
MCRYLIKLPLVYIGVVCLISCSPANNKPILIGFSPDSASIVFSDIDPAGLLQVRNTPGIDTAYSDVISVIPVSGENDSIAAERTLGGTLHITDSTIVFSPSEPFVVGRSYRVISYLNAKFGNVSTMLTGKLNNRVKPVQMILKR